MTNSIKTTPIELLAEKLGGNLWVKGDLKRIYLDEGYNTKKMSTKTYVYQIADQTYKVKCNIDCPGQNDNWIISQQQEVENYVSERIAAIIEEFGTEIEAQPIIASLPLESEKQIQGYYMNWKEVKVPINRFGKLAIRKRMFVVTYIGPKSKAPHRLIELNDTEIELAKAAESKEIAYEYGNEPNFKSDAN